MPGILVSYLMKSFPLRKVHAHLGEDHLGCIGTPLWGFNERRRLVQSETESGSLSESSKSEEIR